MKKVIALLLVVGIAFSLVACGNDKYKPVPSTEEESRVIFTFSIQDTTYEVKYELFRMLFLNYKSEIDGGDSAVWTGENSQKYINAINELIIERAAEIYSTLYYAKSLGYEAYSKEADDDVYESLKLSVEGNGADISGFGGDYNKYLSSLKERNLNYSLFDLLTRYAMASSAIDEYYLGTEDAALGSISGKFEIKEENVRAYYNSEECARVLRMCFAKGIKSAEQMESYREELSLKTDPFDAAYYILSSCGANVVASELIYNHSQGLVSGMIVGAHALDTVTYGEFCDTAFSLADGETSEVFEISDDREYYYIIYKVAKDSEHFSLCYDDVKTSYIYNEMGKNLDTLKASLLNSVSFTDVGESLSYENISMR